MYESLPHLFYASELIEALALLPSPAAVEKVEPSSSRGFTELTAIAAVISALATCFIAFTAWRARNEWENNTKKQAQYDIAKLMADQLPDLSWRVMCAASELKLILSGIHNLKALTEEDLSQYDKQSEIMKACYPLLFNLEKRIYPLLNASGLRPESHRTFIKMTELIDAMHPNGAIFDREYLQEAGHAFKFASQIHYRAEGLWNNFNYTAYRLTS